MSILKAQSKLKQVYPTPLLPLPISLYGMLCFFFSSQWRQRNGYIFFWIYLSPFVFFFVGYRTVLEWKDVNKHYRRSEDGAGSRAWTEYRAVQNTTWWQQPISGPYWCASKRPWRSEEDIGTDSEGSYNCRGPVTADQAVLEHGKKSFFRTRCFIWVWNSTWNHQARPFINGFFFSGIFDFFNMCHRVPSRWMTNRQKSQNGAVHLRFVHVLWSKKTNKNMRRCVKNAWSRAAATNISLFQSLPVSLMSPINLLTGSFFWLFYFISKSLFSWMDIKNGPTSRGSSLRPHNKQWISQSGCFLTLRGTVVAQWARCSNSLQMVTALSSPMPYTAKTVVDQFLERSCCSSTNCSPSLTRTDSVSCNDWY